MYPWEKKKKQVAHFILRSSTVNHVISLAKTAVAFLSI